VSKKVDYQLLADFRYEIRSFLRFSENAAMEMGLQPQQHQLLLTVKGLNAETAPTISNLAARLHLKHHTVVELVDRLCDRGFLIRKGAPSDRRMVHLVITRRGEALLRKLSLIHQQELQAAAPRLLKTLKKLIHENDRENDRDKEAS
jgi:DNA-binding MarR family transcriptional regulator